MLDPYRITRLRRVFLSAGVRAGIPAACPRVGLCLPRRMAGTASRPAPCCRWGVSDPAAALDKGRRRRLNGTMVVSARPA